MNASVFNNVKVQGRIRQEQQCHLQLIHFAQAERNLCFSLKSVLDTNMLSLETLLKSTLG